MTSYAWAIFTVAAAAAQTARNAMQRHLVAKVGVAAASWARFIFALPFALIFLAVVYSFESGAVQVGTNFYLWLVLGSVAQMAATATMLLAMRDRSFVVVTAYLKTEPIQVALFSLVFLAETLTPVRTLAVVLGTAAVMLMSWPRGAAARGWQGPGLGIAAGACFAMSAVGFRGAVTHLDGISYVTAATLSLNAALCIQTLLSIAWLVLSGREALRALFGAWRESLPAGCAGALASQCWFMAFALQAAPVVRTLGLVEMVFAQMVSWRMLREKTTWREAVGIAMLGVAVVLILLA
jgi:drug/metabolite transporter (DMT)-like permease